MADINRLYTNINELAGDKIDVGTPEQFSQALNNPETAKRVYRNLSTVLSKEQIGTENDFLSFVQPPDGVSKPQKQNFAIAPNSQPAIVAPDEKPVKPVNVHDVLYNEHVPSVDNTQMDQIPVMNQDATKIVNQEVNLANTKATIDPKGDNSRIDENNPVKLDGNFDRTMVASAVNSTNALGGAVSGAIGDYYHKMSSMWGNSETLKSIGDFFTEQSNAVSDQVRATDEKYSNPVAKELGGVIPLAIATVADVYSGGALTPAISTTFGLSGYGDGIRAYDEIKKANNEQGNDLARTGAGLGYSAVMLGTMNALGSIMGAKGANALEKSSFVGKAITDIFKSNPKTLELGAKELFETYAKNQPSYAGKLLKSGLHNLGTMEGMELSKMGINAIAGQKQTLDDWLKTATSAAVSSVLFTAIAPFSIGAQNNATMARRAQQKEITIGLVEGKPVEIIQDGSLYKGITPDNKVIDVDQNTVNNSFTMTTDHFNELLTGYKSGSATDPNLERTAFANRLGQTLKNFQSKDGNVTVHTDAKGNKHYLSGVDKDGNIIGVNGRGEENTLGRVETPDLTIGIETPFGTIVDVKDGKAIFEINPIEGTGLVESQRQEIPLSDLQRVMYNDPEASFETANIGDVHQSIMDEYDGKRNSLNSPEQQNVLGETVDPIQNEKDIANQNLAEMTNTDTGTIQTVRLKDQTEVQLLSGSHVAYDENGVIDTDNSSEMLYYKDQDGKTQVLSPENIDRFVQEKPLEQAQAEASQQIDQTIAYNFYPTEPEEWSDRGVVTYPDPQSGSIMAQGIDANGYAVDSPYPITDEEYAQISGKQMPTSVQEQPEQTQQADTEKTSVTYPTLQDGSPDLDKMTDQQFFDYRKESKGEAEAIAATQRQIKRVQTSIQDNTRSLQKLQDNWHTRLGKAKTMQEEAKIESKLESEKAKLENDKETLSQKLQSLNSLIPTQNNEVQEGVQSGVQQSNEQNTANNETVVAENNDVAPVVETQVQEVPESEQIQVRQKPEWTGTAPYTRRLNALGDYTSLEDYILRTVAGGMKFSWNGKESTKGLGEELGFQNSTSEKDWRKSILSEDGVTPQQLTNFIWDEYGGERNEGRIPDMGDYQDTYNTVLETVGSVQNATGALDKAELNRVLVENKMSEQQYVEYMDAPETEEEKQLLDNISDDMLASFLGFSNFTTQQLDELNQFFDGWAEQTINDYGENNATTNTSEHRPDTGSEGRSPENSTEINAQSEVVSGNEGKTEKVVPKNGNVVTYQGEQYVINGITSDSQFVDLDKDGKNVHEDIPVSELSVPTVTDQIAEQHIEENPTEKQKETGEYDKAHVSFFGMPIVVENAKGSVRSGKDENGREWRNEMKAHYGEFEGTAGYDGDPIDCFIGDHEESRRIFVVDQINPSTGDFDESKVMLGYTSPLLAKSGYMKNYERNWKGFKAITETTLEHFQKWLYDGAKQRKPFFEYVDTPSPIEVNHKEPWEMTRKEFSDAVYHGGFDFEQIKGSGNKSIQNSVQAYKATTDTQNKQIAKRHIDRAINAHYNTSLASAIIDGKNVSEKIKEESGIFKPLAEQYDNAPAEKQKVIGAKIIVSLENKYGIKSNAIVVTGHEEFLSEVKQHIPENDYKDFETYVNGGGVHAIRFGDKVWIDTSMAKTSSDLISTWLHEQTHITTKIAFTKTDLAKLYNIIPNVSGFVPSEYVNETDSTKMNEIISFETEKLLKDNSLEGIFSGNIDLSGYPIELQHALSKSLNILTNGKISIIGQQGFDNGGSNTTASEILSGSETTVDKSNTIGSGKIAEQNQGVETPEAKARRERKEALFAKAKERISANSAEYKRSGETDYKRIQIDPELNSIALDLSEMIFEDGDVKFSDYAKQMIEGIGEEVKPYLKGFYELTRYTPGMEGVENMSTPEEVAKFNIEKFTLNKPQSIKSKANATKTKSKTDTTTAIQTSLFEVESLESAVESATTGEQAGTIVEKSKKIIEDIDKQISELQLQLEPYEAGDIDHEQPNVVIEKRISKDIQKYSKALSKQLGWEHDTYKNKPDFGGANIAPSGGNATFVLWKPNSNYGVYVSVTYDADYNGGFDNYKATEILWRITTKQDKWRGLQNMYAKPSIKVGELSSIVEREIKFYDREQPKQEVKPVEPFIENTENTENTQLSENIAVKKDNELKNDVSLHSDSSQEKHNLTTNDEDAKSRLLQPNSNRLPKGKQSESIQGTGGNKGTGRSGELSDGTVSESNGEKQQSTGRKGTVLSGNADLLEPALVEFNPQDNDTNSFNPTRKYADNISALETINTLLRENRKATADEKRILSGYVGFGGLKDILLNPDLESGWTATSEKYRSQVKRIIELSKEFDELTGKSGSLSSIRGSILNAHFTSSSMIKSIYQGIDRLGFKNGNILEPSAGTGNFITFMPNRIKSKSRITAVELDDLTGSVLKYLHDDVTVRISGIQDANVPNNSQDLVISNVPFGNYKVFDKSFTGEKSEFQNRIHNYFFAKAIDQAKEGGIIAFVTSKGVLDSKGNEPIRKYLDKNADFLGAVRLPNNAFKNNANTEVVTDIIFLKKNTTGSKNNTDFVSTKEVEAIHKDGDKQMVTVNNYFVEHPENMLGEIVAGGLYSRDDYTVVEKKGQKVDVAKSLKSILPEGVYQNTTSSIGLQANDSQATIDSVKEGNIEHVNGRLVQKQEGELVDISINEPILKIEAYVSLRNQLMNLIYSEYLGKQDNELDLNRKQLNIEYDNFVKKYGKLDKSIVKIAKVDADGYNVLSLENKGQKADIFSKRTIQPVQSKNHAENINEAIIISLYENASIDIERIAELLNTSVPEAIEQSKGLLFEEPKGGFVTKDEYLSGNVKSKLKLAKKAVDEGYTNFQHNVQELSAVIPADIPALSIEARLGTRWIPESVYTDFAQHLFNSKSAKIIYQKSIDNYVSNGRVDTVEAMTKYGTQRRNGMEILLDALLINPPKIFDTIKELGVEKRVLNADETAKAVEKYEDIRSQFEDWVYKTDERRTLLSGIYNEKYNTTVERTYNGDHLNIAGINGVELRKHQKDAVWMLLQNNGGIIDHLVGAGKTFVMVAGTMEMRRTGIAKKPMIIALKSTIPQIVETYRSAYPMAKILAPLEKDFKKENRKKLFSQIANNEWDCIVMSHDNYGKIPHEDDIQKKFIQDEIDEIQNERFELESAGEKQALKGLEIRIKNLEARLEKISSLDKDNSLTFQQMGIDHIMVDESQMFKNLSYVTKQRGVAGLSKPEGSKRAFNLFIGMRYLQGKYGADKGTTFLSGTPISNSMVEMYLLLKYMRPQKMAELGFNSFDAWATTFASPSSDIEFTVTGDFKAKTRFREFINVPELSIMYREIADIRTDENLKLDKPTMKDGGYTAVSIEMSPEQQDYSQRLMEFARTKDGSHIGMQLDDNKKTAIMLIATNLSSKMAIDMRMIDPTASYDPNGKIAKCAENVARIFKETEAFKGTQLIFSDLGTPKNKTNKTSLLRDYMEDELGTNLDTLNEIFGDPNEGAYKFPSMTTVTDKLKSVLELSDNEIESMLSDSENSAGGFNVYDELKKRIVENGVPEDQVVYIHDYNSQRAKEKLFKLVNSGQIRVILGSTQKLGTGVNVQDRLSAIHHVDVPWTPAAMEQRNGRGLRQGNWAAKQYLNNELPVFAYATQRTLDAYKYSLLQMKQHFLNQVKSGNTEDRSITEESGDGEVGLAELAAITSGNTDILTKSKLEQKIAKLRKSKRNFLGELYEAEKKIGLITDRIPTIEKNISKTKESISFFENNVTKDEDGRMIVQDINGKVLKGEKKKPAEKLDYIKEAIEITKDKLSRVPELKMQDLFSIGKIDVSGYRQVLDQKHGGDKKFIYVEAPNGERYSTNYSETPGIFYNNIQKTIDNLPGTLGLQENTLTKAKKDLVSYKEIIDKGDNWEKEKELESLIQELKEVTKRLDSTSKPKEDQQDGEEVSYKREKPQPPVILPTDTAIETIKKNRDYQNSLQEWQKTQINNIAESTGETLTPIGLGELNRSVNRINAKLWEGWADAAKPMKKFQDFLRSNGISIPDNNDYYLRLTTVPSRIEYRFDSFKNEVMKPFVSTLKAIKDKGFTYDDITTYAKLKHADEYTENLLVRKFVNKIEKQRRLIDAVTGSPDWIKQNDALDARIEKYKTVTVKQEIRAGADLAGKEAIEKRVGQSTEEYIQNFEDENGSLVDEFWKHSKEVSHYALNEEVRGGMRTKESAEGIKNMFDYYIPLKGHRNATAEDLWDYSNETGDYFFSAVKKGKGRTSESDDPFSVMESTVRSAIGAAEENLLLQTVLRLAESDTTGSITSNKTWFVKDGDNVDEDGNPAFKVADEVPYNDDDTQETYDAKIIEFNKKMNDLFEKGEAYQSGRESKLNLGVWIKPTNEREHEVVVKRNGESYTIRFHTSPRIPQSINGTNVRHYDGAVGKTLEGIGWTTRHMAGFKTLWRPAFILITNPLRDIHAGLNLSYISDGADFTGNVIANFPYAVKALSKRAIGKVDLNNKHDKMLNDFLLNGGKTGISKIMEIKQVQRELEKQLNGKSVAGKVSDKVFDIYHTVSDITENQMRLAVYITAIEKGYSVVRATAMAKEATVNFDRKGNGRNGLRELKSTYAFINVGFQALDNIWTKSTQSKATKTRAGIAIAANVLSGALLVAGLNTLLCKLFGHADDEWLTEAAKMSSFERNANFLIWTPNGFLKVPLGQEFRMYHGLGMDMMLGMNGKVSPLETTVNLMKGLTSLVPYNPIEATAQGSIANALPDLFSPAAEVYVTNKDWLGTSITKENQPDEKPGYEKVRTNKRGEAYAPEMLVKLSKALDHATGGDGVMKGIVSPNPDIINHLLGGYFAGIYEQPMTIVEGFLSEKDGALMKEFTPKAIWKDMDDIHSRNTGLNEKYYDAKDEADATGFYIKGYNKQLEELKSNLDKGTITPIEYTNQKSVIDAKLKELESGNYYDVEGFKKTITDLQKELPNQEKSEQIKTENTISELKENVVNLKDGKEVKEDNYYEVEAKYNSKLKQVQEYKAKRALKTIDIDPELEKLSSTLYRRPPAGSSPNPTSLHAKIEKLQKRMEKSTGEEKKDLEQQTIKLINKLP